MVKKTHTSYASLLEGLTTQHSKKFPADAAQTGNRHQAGLVAVLHPECDLLRTEP
jgi:hypothetical protein